MHHLLTDYFLAAHNQSIIRRSLLLLKSPHITHCMTLLAQPRNHVEVGNFGCLSRFRMFVRCEWYLWWTRIEMSSSSKQQQPPIRFRTRNNCLQLRLRSSTPFCYSFITGPARLAPPSLLLSSQPSTLPSRLVLPVGPAVGPRLLEARALAPGRGGLQVYKSKAKRSLAASPPARCPPAR